jgi:hypothetical protein
MWCCCYDATFATAGSKSIKWDHAHKFVSRDAVSRCCCRHFYSTQLLSSILQALPIVLQCSSHPNLSPDTSLKYTVNPTPQFLRVQLTDPLPKDGMASMRLLRPQLAKLTVSALRPPTARPFSRATSLRKAIINPRTDDDGNLMDIDITPRAANVKLCFVHDHRIVLTHHSV